MTELENKAEELARNKARNYKTVYSEDSNFEEVMKDPLRFDQDYPKRLYLLMKEKHYRDGYADGYLEAYEQGYEDCRHYAHDYYKPKWHDLRKNPDDLPKCTENEQIIFYVKEYYESFEKYINHFCLGFYRKSFMNDDVKLFVERSKGYECEHSTEDVLRWCELPKFEN